jgi:cytosine/adenosine deaminase-related metal-dependent hydrolase
MNGVPCDLLIHNACLITMDPGRRILHPGALAVRGQRILAVGSERELGEGYIPRERIDARGGLVHPGFIDAHNHIVHTSCRGVFRHVFAPGEVRFADWKADVNEHDEVAAVVVAGLEMLRSGFTLFIEPGSLFAPDAAADAVERVGIRALFSPLYLWDRREPFDAIPALESARLMARAPIDHGRCMGALDAQLHRNRYPDARVRGYIFVYGEGTGSLALMRAAHACAREHGVPLHLHAGYVPRSGEIYRAVNGSSQLEQLEEAGVLDGETVIVHANALAEGEERALRARGCQVVWCPAAYFSLGLAGQTAFRMGQRLRDGTRISLGADGAFDGPIAESMRAARFLSQSFADPVSPEALLEMQTINGAAAAGMAGELGSLEPGKRADVVLRRPGLAEAFPDNNPAHVLALNLGPGSVDTVLVDGRIVFRHGESTLVDAAQATRALSASVRARARRLGLDAAGRWPVVGPDRSS